MGAGPVKPRPNIAPALLQGVERPARRVGVLEVGRAQGRLELAPSLLGLALLRVDHAEVIPDLTRPRRGLRDAAQQLLGAAQLTLLVERPPERVRYGGTVRRARERFLGQGQRL